MRLAPLIVISGPAGAGKSTLIRRLLVRWPDRLRLSVSATTRPPRPGEQEGVDYHFWTEERFRAGIQAGEFLEHAVVHGNYYGTPRSEVDDYRARGVGVILDIDVQGAAQIRPLYPDQLSVFVRTSTDDIYLQRLRHRGTEDEAAIARRLASARRELERVGEYQHVIVNDDLETAVAELQGLVEQALGG